MTDDILETMDEIDENGEDTALEGVIEEDSSDEMEFSSSRAREVTEAIKYAATATYALIYEAYQYKAHKALGYSNWGDYVKEEFQMSKSRSYQLISQAESIKQIEEAAPESTNFRLTEAQVRDLKSELPRITQTIQEETSGMSPEEAEGFIDDLLQQEREQAKADKEASDRKKAELEDAQGEGYQSALDDVANQMLGEGDGEIGPEEDNSVNTPKGGGGFEPDSVNDFSDAADSGFYEAEVEGHGQSISSEDALNLYNFFNMLSNLTELPEPDDFIELISEDRKEEVDNQIIEAASWINKFVTLWESRD